MPARDPAGDPGDPIAQLLAGRYPDPETGELLAADSRAVVIADSLEGQEAALVESLGVGKRLAVIGDANTFAALGRRVCAALERTFAVQAHLLDAPHADSETVARIQAALDPAIDAIIAVGSGTLNDLAKMVAYERNIPQLVFATAPSMNGYTSVSASIMTDGMKRSHRVRTPVGVFFDLAVIAAAPRRLLLAGVGDSVCRSTAQADWLLSHLLLDRPYREAPFAILAADERALFAQIPALLAGDLAAMRSLVRTLVLSGFGMTLAGGSFPASQGEHLLSHYIEMMGGSELADWYHGEQIGVCTVAMARLQDAMLARDTAPVLQPGRLTRDDLIAHYGPVIGEGCWLEYEAKRFDEAQTAALNDRLAASWAAIRARIGKVTIGAAAVERLLTAAGAPVEPEALGWPPALFDKALTHARELRNRYTFLDVSADSIR